MQTNNTTPATVYTVITYQIFGQIETVDTFSSREDAEANVVEWSNINRPDGEEEYKTFDEAMDYFADSSDENMEVTIRLYESTVIGNNTANILQAVYDKFNYMDTNHFQCATIGDTVYDRIVVDYYPEEMLELIKEKDCSVVVSLYSEDNDSAKDLYFDAFELAKAEVVEDKIIMETEDGEKLIIEFSSTVGDDEIEEQPLVLQHEENGTDFILTGGSCWITVNNLSVYVKKDEEGVVVDVYSKNHEMDSAIGSTWVSYAEGKEDDEKKLEKFECMDCGCYFMVENRDGFCCPNCEDKRGEVQAEEYSLFALIEKDVGAIKLYDTKKEALDALDSIRQTSHKEYLVVEELYDANGNHYDSAPIKSEEKCEPKEGSSSSYDLYEKEIQEILEYAKVGDYLACIRDQDVWNEVLNYHTDIYPYERSFDQYDTEWFLTNSNLFVEFLTQVIARETTNSPEAEEEVDTEYFSLDDSRFPFIISMHDPCDPGHTRGIPDYFADQINIAIMDGGDKDALEAEKALILSFNCDYIVVGNEDEEV